MVVGGYIPWKRVGQGRGRFGRLGDGVQRRVGSHSKKLDDLEYTETGYSCAGGFPHGER
jgi:hypothetical protein